MNDLLKSNTWNSIKTYRNESLKTLKKRIEQHEAAIHVFYADAAELTQIIKKLDSYYEETIEKAIVILNKTLADKMELIKEHGDLLSLINWIIEKKEKAQY